MKNKMTLVLTAAAVLISARMVSAQEGAKAAAAEGTLTLQDKKYALKYAVAYETKTDDTDVIAVVLSGQTISAEAVKAAIEPENDDDFPSFKKPYLRLEFTKDGELKHWSAATQTTSIGRRSRGKAMAELSLQDNRAVGKASQPMDTEGMFPTGFDVRFDVAVLKAGEIPTIAPKTRGPAANVKGTVTGVFKGNGKDAKLAHVSAHWREPFGDEPSIVLVFTEKDHSRDRKADITANFGKYGSALLISLHEDGSIFGCQVVHSAHSKSGFTSLGKIRTNDFEYTNGKVEGELTTDGELETFGETWEANLKFVAPLGETPPEFQPKQTAESTAPKTKTTNAKTTPPASDDDEDQPAASGSAMKGKDLPLTKDATDVEYKKLVGHVVYKSKSGVKAVAAELTASLKAQGWTSDGSDMVNPSTAILKRKQGGATLTIFVKPTGDATEVKMLTDGLDWDE